MEFVTDMAAKRAELAPHDIAFHDVERSTTLTYAEVNAQTNSVAHALLGLGARVGDRIGALCHNWPEFFVLLFVCQKRGSVTGRHGTTWVDNPLVSALFPSVQPDTARHG